MTESSTVDSAHVALAEQADCDFVTCDDRLPHTDFISYLQCHRAQVRERENNQVRLVDVGPHAGTLGGTIVYEGRYAGTYSTEVI